MFVVLFPLFPSLNNQSNVTVEPALFTAAEPTREAGVRLRVSRVDRAAQPGAMGAPSYVQPDHWDQVAHQLFHGSKAPADPGLCKSAPLPLSLWLHLKNGLECKRGTQTRSGYRVDKIGEGFQRWKSQTFQSNVFLFIVFF